MIRTERGPLLGNWRASAYGAARPAHLFPGQTHDRARPVCGRAVAYRRTAAVRSRPLRELCYDCLPHAAAGRWTESPSIAAVRSAVATLRTVTDEAIVDSIAADLDRLTETLARIDEGAL